MADPRRAVQILTNDQVVAQAVITPDDIELARSWWKRHITGPLKTLLDAGLKGDVQ